MPGTQSQKIAAIDIGSNAMRAVFAHVSKKEVTFFKNFRFPLRLGADVFKGGKISGRRMKKTEEAFGELFLKLSSFNIQDVRAVATSAMRDSSNGQILADRIKAQTGIEIEIIDGNKEAALLKKAVERVVDLKKKTALMIDVGGGSAEVTLTKNGKTIVSKSFQFGTVRMLESAQSMTFEKEVQKFSNEVKELILPHCKRVQLFIGTGGNLRRMGKLRKLALKKPSNKILLHELQDIYMELSPLSPPERIERYNMRKDRADVIVYAMAMIERIMVDLGLGEVHLPRVGLKEGVVIDGLEGAPRKLRLQIRHQ